MINAISTGFGAAWAWAAPAVHPTIPADVRIAAVKLISGFVSDPPPNVLAMLCSLLSVALRGPDG